MSLCCLSWHPPIQYYVKFDEFPEGQTDREMFWQTDGQTNRHTHTHIYIYRERDRRTVLKAVGPIDEQPNRQIKVDVGIQMDRETNYWESRRNEQADRQTTK
jgi:hypothetical protein